MKFLLSAFLSLSMLLAMPAGADVWRCTDARGHAVYQDEPCPEGSDTGIASVGPEDAPISAKPAAVTTIERDGNGRIVRSEAAKNAFKRSNPCPATGARRGSCPGYVIDHIKARACGGADDPSNMQWQTIADSKAKDAWERDGCDAGSYGKFAQGSGKRGAGRQLAIETGDSSGGSVGSQEVHIGPRGGRYVITSGGNKRYIK
jgi:hypothetical protein